MLGEYTNNKMATPAPVQLQRWVTVSDLVCCVFVYVNVIEILLTCGSYTKFIGNRCFNNTQIFNLEMDYLKIFWRHYVSDLEEICIRVRCWQMGLTTREQNQTPTQRDRWPRHSFTWMLECVLGLLAYFCAEYLLIMGSQSFVIFKELKIIIRFILILYILM